MNLTNFKKTILLKEIFDKKKQKKRKKRKENSKKKKKRKKTTKKRIGVPFSEVLNSFSSSEFPF
jgi:hypothetical protein